MDLYHFVLLIHIVTFVVAGGATALVKLSLGRRARARTVGEMMDWHRVLAKSARAFPICLAFFLITGGYMMSIAHVAPTSGFIVAGVAGIVLLLLGGIFMGVKAKALSAMLDGLAKNGLDQPAPTLSAPPLMAALPMINSGLVLGVAFDMAMKPEGIAESLGIVAIGIVLGALIGMRKPATAPAAQAEGSK